MENSFHSEGSFSQNQNTSYRIQREEESQALYQFQNPSNKPFRIYSQPQSDFNDLSGHDSMVRATSDPAHLNSHKRISEDEDHKHQEFQLELSSAEHEKDQLTSDEKSRNESIAYYRREIKNNQEQSESSLDFSKKCRYPSRAGDEAYEEHLRCEERISHLHNMCGYMLTKQYKYQDAVLEFQQASKIRSQVVNNYNGWGDQLNTPKNKSYAQKKYGDAQYYKFYFTQIYGNWGWALTRLKDFGSAIQKYSDALEIDRNVRNECKKWGYGFVRSGKFQKDREKYLAQIYRNWGYTLSQQEKYEEALEKYDQIQRLNVRDTSIYTDMGFCHDRLGDKHRTTQRFQKDHAAQQDHKARAVEYYQKAIDENPKSHDILSEAHYLWGRSLDEKGEHEEAIKKLREASRLENLINERKGKKVIIKSSNRLCLVYYKLKRYGEALSIYEELKDGDNPRYAYVYIYVGLIYAQIDYRQSKGEKYLDYSETEKMNPEKDYYLKLAIQNFNKAIKLYDGIYKENPGFKDDCVDAIEKEIERNKKLLKRDPQNNDESRVIIAKMQTVLRNVLDLQLIPDDSFNNQVLQAQSPENFDSFIELKNLDNYSSQSDGLSILSKNQTEDSTISAEQLLDSDNCTSQSDGLSIVSRNQIEDSLISEVENLVNSIKQKNAEEQIAYIEKYIEHFKSASENWLDSYKRNLLQEKSLKKYIKLELDISSICSNWGYQLSKLHQYEEALVKFEEAERRIQTLTNLCKVGSKRMHSCYNEVKKEYNINNKLSGICKNWGFALSRLGRFKDAENKYRSALKWNSRNGSAYQNLGFVLSRLGKDKQAIQNYEEGEKYCRDPKIHIYWGFSLTVLGQFSEAIKIYESLANDESQEISIRCDAYYEWANTLDEMGESEDAMVKLNDALKLQKSSDNHFDPRLLNRLGLLYYHNKEYEKAQELFEDIIDQDPNYGFAYINKGLVQSQIYHIKSKLVAEVSRDQSHLSDKDKTEIETIESIELMRCKDDIDTYQRTITELSKIKEKLEAKKENGLLKLNTQKDQSESYEEGFRIVQESSYLQHDYIYIYEKEAKKIGKRLSKCKEEKEELTGKRKTESSEQKKMDPKVDFNNSLLVNSIEIHDKPLGF